MTSPSCNDCIFCKIIAGNIPCHKIYEDEHVLSFLDIGPVTYGHTLVIPKAHYTRLDQLPQALASHTISAVPKIAQAILKATDTKDFNLLQNNGPVAGQVVDHVHFHIIPRSAEDAFKINWPAQDLGTPQALQLLNEIKANL